MLPFQIKICGITSADDALCACHGGADAIGLNFFGRSPRYIDEEAAGIVVEAIDSHNDQLEQSGADMAPVQGQISTCHVKKVGVFVNNSVSEMVETAKKLDLDTIQLHGDENPAIISAIGESLRDIGCNCLLIRAIRTKPAAENADVLRDERTRVAREILHWANAGIDAVLLDAAVPSEFGGTGIVVDWSAIPDLNCPVPLILAGGLNPGNVADAIEASNAASVDVASGVESSPGVKDHAMVRSFIAEARKALV